MPSNENIFWSAVSDEIEKCGGKEYKVGKELFRILGLLKDPKKMSKYKTAMKSGKTLTKGTTKAVRKFN